MRNLILRFAVLGTLALIAGFPSAPPAGDSRYPAEITGVGDSSNFPLRVGPYQRGKMIMYQPDMKDHSIAYDRYDSDLQNAVTLYFYPLARPTAEQFAAEKQEILHAHRGSVVLGEKEISLQKNGASFPALIATFRFDEVFAGRQQTVFSELVLVALPNHYFKVRSSASFDQGTIAEGSMLELLERVNWAY